MTDLYAERVLDTVTGKYIIQLGKPFKQDIHVFEKLDSIQKLIIFLEIEFFLVYKKREKLRKI
jgi:hypothetical protein